MPPHVPESALLRGPEAGDFGYNQEQPAVCRGIVQLGQKTPKTQPNAQYLQSASDYNLTDKHHVVFPIAGVRFLFEGG